MNVQKFSTLRVKYILLLSTNAKSATETVKDSGEVSANKKHCALFDRDYTIIRRTEKLRAFNFLWCSGTICKRFQKTTELSGWDKNCT